ncbi:hypothetical protein [Gluconobacter cadivus]|uniref:hypothetical protein n=1 Tax=Gluconobacter cadivus TaxID=2728101 RepID=UPI001F33C74E|nr:hypothetical protein [Gluconobacter cadivus]
MTQSQLFQASDFFQTLPCKFTAENVIDLPFRQYEVAMGATVFLMNHQSHALRVSTQFQTDLIGEMGELPIAHRFGWIESNMPQTVSNTLAFRFFHPIVEKVVTARNNPDGFVLCARQNVM